ncbi:MAG: RNA 3'-phosphate cyclase [Thermoplasmata archaeon]|nr:MAG: RNA 3'-phosphate cyclase [Thermoplasmata archaeon]
MITIDGSYGEGGGQILRTAVALSAVTGKSVEVTNIRANRPNPGIKPQHYTSIKIIKELCNASIEGLEIGSNRIVFRPGKLKGGRYRFDVGTAGSIVLVYQACLLAAVQTTQPITLHLKGGTDVKWSPSWDYFEFVFLPLLRKMGVQVDAKLLHRGYYPKGGGEAEISIKSIENLRSIRLDKTLDCRKVEGIIHIANLPEHIATRMKHAALKVFINKNIESNIQIVRDSSLSPGTGITLWTKCDGIHLGKTGLGERGVSAEEIGRRTAEGLIEELYLHATVDINLFDQLIPYMALAKDESICFVKEISKHAETCIWLVSHFLDKKFEIEKKDEIYKVRALSG